MWIHLSTYLSPSICLGLVEIVSDPLKTNMSPENQWLEDVFPTDIINPL